MICIPSLFGSKVFNEGVMKERLPGEIYKTLKKTIRNSEPLDVNVANVVANAMKDWAIENGATHYTHWFQPMTGITAEKHDSFISLPQNDGSVIMEFSGKELIKGEPDASSFPSGGLRATFEARGYTAWDPTSYAFIKENTLCIPTAFCSYGGQSLDKKTPLLRSMDALSAQALRILRLFGNTQVLRVNSTVGAEQEYFLVDKELYLRRRDLRFTGRTLVGAEPPKGQEMDYHYFGAIKPRVKAFMRDLDEELWALGISAKTEHNEAAPAQHELAPIFASTNIATDHNQLTMELMKKVADRHGLVCLLHEKPFAGINGSGKHNNWSMATNTGKNLLDPGTSPHENAQFLLFLVAVIKAVDEHQDLLRISVASAGNDHRLGGFEAPPAIISIFLGDELTEILHALETGEGYRKKDAATMKIGVDVLPSFPKDTTDRNRTSPFAFTGNKFEFRSLGSSASVSTPNVVINTIVADTLKEFADELENADNFEDALQLLIKRTIREHKRIIFNGNGYTEDWIGEAERRGLLNLRTTPEALDHYTDSKNIALFSRHGVFSGEELVSRTEILTDIYCQMVSIEARTLSEMMRKDVLPAVSRYTGQLSSTAAAKRALSETIDCTVELELVTTISDLSSALYYATEALDNTIRKVATIKGLRDRAYFYKDEILPAMDTVRIVCDALEKLVAEDFWPYPTYEDLLFKV